MSPTVGGAGAGTVRFVAGPTLLKGLAPPPLLEERGASSASAALSEELRRLKRSCCDQRAEMASQAAGLRAEASRLLLQQATAPLSAAPEPQRRRWPTALVPSPYSWPPGPGRGTADILPPSLPLPLQLLGSAPLLSPALPPFVGSRKAVGALVTERPISLPPPARSPWDPTPGYHRRDPVGTRHVQAQAQPEMIALPDDSTLLYGSQVPSATELLGRARCRGGGQGSPLSSGAGGSPDRGIAVDAASHAAAWPSPKDAPTPAAPLAAPLAVGDLSRSVLAQALDDENTAQANDPADALPPENVGSSRRLLYLPKAVSGVPVLVAEEAGDGKEWRLDNSKLQGTSPGLRFRNSKDICDQSFLTASWGEVVEGEDEADGWVKCSVPDSKWRAAVPQVSKAQSRPEREPTAFSDWSSEGEGGDLPEGVVEEGLKNVYISSGDTRPLEEEGTSRKGMPESYTPSFLGAENQDPGPLSPGKHVPEAPPDGGAEASSGAAPATAGTAGREEEPETAGVPPAAEERVADLDFSPGMASLQYTLTDAGTLTTAFGVSIRQSTDLGQTLLPVQANANASSSTAVANGSRPAASDELGEDKGIFTRVIDLGAALRSVSPGAGSHRDHEGSAEASASTLAAGAALQPPESPPDRQEQLREPRSPGGPPKTQDVLMSALMPPAAAGAAAPALPPPLPGGGGGGR
jgi:hypothetical protein